jgi:RNA polymerase sigma-70 factor (ECF subfamily)
VTDSSDGPDRALDPEVSDTPVHVRALEALYRQHGADLEAFLIGVFRDQHQAAEVVQIVFRKALEHLAQLESTEKLPKFKESEESVARLLSKWQSPRGWLFRVAWNEAMLVRRVKTRHQNLLQKAVWNRDLDQPEPSAPHSGLVQDETVEAVRKAINELPEEQRTVVRSRIYEDKTFAVIAEELGVPLGTVLTRMRLAMQKLERSLAKDQRPE